MSEAWIGLLASVVTGVLSLIGVYIANRKSQNLIAYRLEQLEKKMDKHNQVVERIYNLEGRADVLEEKISVVNHRIADIERHENDGK